MFLSQSIHQLNEISNLLLLSIFSFPPGSTNELLKPLSVNLVLHELLGLRFDKGFDFLLQSNRITSLGRDRVELLVLHSRYLDVFAGEVTDFQTQVSLESFLVVRFHY